MGVDSIENFRYIENCVEKYFRGLLVFPFVGYENRDVNFSGFKNFDELPRAVHNTNLKSMAVVLKNHISDDFLVQLNVKPFDDCER